MKLMIVDDDPKVRFNLNLFLSDEGFECHEFGNAEEALHTIGTGSYKAAIVDIALPGLFGDEFIVKANRIDPNLKYIIYTGHLSFTLSHELRSIGVDCDDVFYKPVRDMKSLKERISFLNEV